METLSTERSTSMSQYKSLRLVDYSQVEKGLYGLHLDLQGEKVNKFSREFSKEMQGMIQQLKDRTDIKALIVFSDKESIFIAGADIELIRGIKKPEDGYNLAREAQDMIAQITKFSFPVIAAINGACLGGGLEFSLCCKYLIASDAPSVKIGLPEVNLGVLPGMGGTVRLPKRVGLQTALDMILSGKQLNGERAFKAGLVNAVLPFQDFNTRALQWAAKVARGEKFSNKVTTGFANRVLEGTWAGRMVLFSQAKKMVLSRTRGHYPAPIKIIDLMASNFGANEKQALEREQRGFGELAATDVSKRLIELFFLTEKIKKQSGVEGYKLSAEDKISKIGLLGAGVMGGGIAQLCAQKGYGVRMKDIDFKGLGIGMMNASKLFNDLVKKRRMGKKDAEFKFNLISPTTEFTGIGNTEVVIEAVVENIDVKRKVLKETETYLSSTALFASNTSSLSITEIASGASRPENVVGMHFFNPVHKMPLVEVIRGEKTNDRAVAMIFDLSKKLGKTPIVCKDGPGFLVNRLLLPYMNEAVYLIEEGAAIDELDEVVLQFGMPMGPANLMDEVGIDVGIKVSKILHGSFGMRAEPSKLNDKLVNSKLLGKKGGKGFYIYDERGKKKELNPEIYGVLGVTPKSANEAQKKEWLTRMMLAMINEASICLAEGIVATAEEVDLGMIMGTGFPPFRGGLLRYADTIGVKKIHSELERLAKQAGKRFTPSAAITERAQKNKAFYS